MHEGKALKKAVKLDERSPAEIAEKLGIERTYIYELYKKPELDPFYRKRLREMGIYLDKIHLTGFDNYDKVQEGIPVYDTRVSGGGVEMYPDVGERPARFVTVPGLEDCDFGMYVYGNSMAPTIESGCMIVAKKIKDKGLIIWGELYVVLTEDYRMVKRLQHHKSKGFVLCVSDNYDEGKPAGKRFEPIEIELDKIRDLYLVKGIVKKTQS